jgi:hypothetical protein
MDNLNFKRTEHLLKTVLQQINEIQELTKSIESKSIANRIAEMDVEAGDIVIVAPTGNREEDFKATFVAWDNEDKTKPIDTGVCMDEKGGLIYVHVWSLTKA